MPSSSPWWWLADRIGVTRVARITGLDRTGVEVACAVRPGGHVLQVSNGKGETFEQAGWGAVLEAAELFCAELVDPEPRFATRRELKARFGEEHVWDAGELGSAGELIAPRLWSLDTRVAWQWGGGLGQRDYAYVPEQALRCPPQGAAPLGPALLAWTSNGMGAHRDHDSAVIHALLEAIERDELATVLPDGWTAEELRGRLIDPRSLERHAPVTAARREAIEAGGFEVHLFDLTGRFGFPVGGALLLDREKGHSPLVAGYACRFGRDDALLAALLEAAQSRLTDIHGAREDVRSEELDLEPLRALLAGLRPTRSAARMPQHTAPQGWQAVRPIQKALKRRGLTRVAVFDLAPAELGIHVIKVVIPGLQVSALL